MMKYCIFLILLLIGNCFNKTWAGPNSTTDSAFLMLSSSTENLSENTVLPGNVLIDSLKLCECSKNCNCLKTGTKLRKENKKLTAAVLTLTLGMLGVHRLYLGTKPWIPAVYLFTLGGGLFILPFIDLVVILLSDDIKKFENNSKVFMWAN